MEKSILIFESSHGHCPFLEWLLNLNDVQGRATIRARIERVRLGNLGDCKTIGNGVSELRISFGPGYRLYFGQDGLNRIIFLCGGDKSTQTRDIIKAKQFWMEYKSETKKLSN